MNVLARQVHATGGRSVSTQWARTLARGTRLTAVEDTTSMKRAHAALVRKSSSYMQSVLLAYLRWISWCSLSLAPLLTDIDECKTTENVCGGHACLNMLGSYRCECEAGYMFNSITRLCEGKLFFFCFCFAFLRW